MVNWLDLYAKAVIFATTAHDGQRRKWADQPYILHPLRVSKKVLELTGDLKLATAGILHDVIEDCRVEPIAIATDFGDQIAIIVESLTKRKELPRKQKNAEYLMRFNCADTNTVILKLADRLDNICSTGDAPTDFKDRYAKETIELVEAIPKTALNDPSVIVLLKDVTAWTMTGRIQKP